MSNANIPPEIQDDTRIVYTFVRDYLDEHNGYAPSHREIAEGCFLSRGSITRHLDRLVFAGYLDREDGRARSLRLTGLAPDWDE